MKAAIWFRVAAILIALFAAGHTFGFRQVDPRWGIHGVITAMQSMQFQTQGFTRTYWDFYVGFGFFCSVFLLFAAAVAWRLGGLESMAARGLGWTLTACFGCVVVLSWRYFFFLPMILSGSIFLCLLAGTLLVSRQASS